MSYNLFNTIRTVIYGAKKCFRGTLGDPGGIGGGGDNHIFA